MKNVKLIHLSIILFSSVLFLNACTTDDNNIEPDCYCLYGEYTNYEEDGKPTFRIDSLKSSSSINYGETSVFPVETEDGERMRISVPFVTAEIRGKGKNILGFEVEEYREGSWVTQSEFSSSEDVSEKNMAIVMVLDMSASLGDDVFKVKETAISFATSFLASTQQEGYIGLVLFSEEVDTVDFTNDINIIKQRINSYSNYKSSTTLYGAMQTGLEMLDDADLGVEVKAMVTFTDGRDNNTNSPSFVKNEIISSSIQKYMIGLEGNATDYSQSILQELASFGENFANANDIESLENAFADILSQVTNIYVVKYDRTMQTFSKDFDEPIEIRISFELED